MSVGGGKSGSSGSSTTISPYAAMLAKFGVQNLKAAEPVTQQLLSQEGEALRTGGVTNQIPLINRGVDAARQAGSQSNQSAQQLISQYGLSGSAFGARLMAEQNQQNNQNVANVPAEVTQSILSQAPAVSANAGALGAGLLGTAGGLDTTTKSRQSGYNFDASASLSDLLALGKASGGGPSPSTPGTYEQLFQPGLS